MRARTEVFGYPSRLALGNLEKAWPHLALVVAYWYSTHLQLSENG
jgi:hypothetical protein